MVTMVSRLFIPGLLFIFTLVTGVWLSRFGKPLNVVIFTIHKSIALIATILTVVMIYHLHSAFGMRLVAEVSAVVVTILSILVLFISGAYLNLGKPLNAAVLTVHKVTPLLAAFSTTVAIYLLVF